MQWVLKEVIHIAFLKKQISTVGIFAPCLYLSALLFDLEGEVAWFSRLYFFQIDLLVYSLMTAESGKERKVFWGATEKTVHCGFHKSFFFRATLSHRIQINNSENTVMLLLHGTVKNEMNSLGQNNTVVLIHSKLKVLLGDTVLFVLWPWVLMFQHQFT